MNHNCDLPSQVELVLMVTSSYRKGNTHEATTPTGPCRSVCEHSGDQMLTTAVDACLQRWCCQAVDITQDRATSSILTPEQAAFARSYVTAAHANGRQLRFWNTNDNPEVRFASGSACSVGVRIGCEDPALAACGDLM